MGASITRAMRSFALWVSQRPYRVVLLTIGLVRLLALIAAALLVLDALRRGPGPAAISAAASLLGVLLVGILIGSSAAETLSVTVPILVGGAASGALLSRSRSLSLAFQGTVIGFVGLVLVIFTVWPEASRIGEILLDEVVALLRTGGVDGAYLAQWEELSPADFLSILMVAMLVSLVGALLLGLWWYALIAEGIRFGNEFRALQLGRVAGITLMGLVILGQLVDGELVRNLASLAVVGFLFQGLAVMHARSHSDKWPGAVVTLVYLVLVIPWTRGVALMAVSAIGLIDNVFPLRARATPRPGA